MIISILLAPGILIFAISRHEHGERIFPQWRDRVIVVIILGFALLSLYLHFSGIWPIV